jgi:hypothetical protein
MSTSSLFSTSAPANTQALQAMIRQRQQDFQSLASSLQSANLSGAQQAYSDLQSLATANAASAVPASGTTPAQQAFAVLGQDLSSGNITQAQKDFTQMKADLQTARTQRGGGHHHGHCAPKADASSETSTSANPDTILPTASSGLLSQYAANATQNSTASSLMSLLG